MSIETRSSRIHVPLQKLKGEISILNQNYIAKLLNLEEAIIKNVENKSDQLFIQIELPRAISVDEFKGNSGGEKYNCILADPENGKVLNAMDVPWTNGYIEGCNKKTKALKRTCYGMSNFKNFRKKILFCNA